MAIRYIPYQPDILSGQAVLDNFVRTRRILEYKGRDGVLRRLNRGMPLYDVALKERIGENPDGNMLIRGECISACAYLKSKGVTVDLVYIDPPFASGADYAKKVYLRRNPKVAEAIDKAEQELDSDDTPAFYEKMYGDVWNKEDYLNWMYENLMAIKSVMSETASIYVHLDWHIGHYVKILMDEIFGEDNFKNEIIWGYRIQGVGKDFWARKHDTIFFYTKSDDYVFHAEKEDVIYEKPFIDTLKEEPDLRKIDERIKKDIISALEDCKPLKDKYKQMLFNKYYSNVYVRDVWDCDKTKPIISGSSEYLDYKTQKPEALLERIIKASSDKGMVVADFFGGSGVTAAVANKLGRKFVHCDVGINSIQTTRDRLMDKQQGKCAEFDLLEVKDGVSLFRNPVQTMDKLKTLITGFCTSESIQKPWVGYITSAKYGMMPVFLPDLKGTTQRLLDRPLANEIVCEHIANLPDETQKVIIYYIDVTDLDDINKFIYERNNTLIKVELRDLKELLDDVTAEDYAAWEVKEEQTSLFTGWKVELTMFKSDRIKKKIDDLNKKREQQVLKQRSKGKDATYTPITLSESGLETVEMVSLDCTSAEKDDTWYSDSEVKIDKAGYVIRNGVKTKVLWNATITADKKPLRMKVRNICGDETIYVL